MDWQPIETAPTDAIVLVFGGMPDGSSDELEYDDDYRPFWPMARPVSAWWDAGRWRYCDYDSGYYGILENPTHWMPLPKAPLD